MQKLSEIYRNLYHYTTWGGLMGILKTQTLWATHYKFLNDYSELILIESKLVEYVSHVVKQAFLELIKKDKRVEKAINQNGGLNQVVKHDTISTVRAAYDATGDEIYIVSFCGEHENDYVNRNGLLSQWRGYGAGGGIALEFETDKLEEIVVTEANENSYDTGHMSDVIYSDDEEKFKKELSANLDEFNKYVKEMFLHAKLNEEELPDATRAFPSFVQCISRYKHHSFKEENEVRIVCLATNQNEKFLTLAKKAGSIVKPEKVRQFRTKKGKRIPYIELFNSPDIILPIKRIIVGPHKDKEYRAATLRVMLRKTDIEVTVSDIPYID